MQKLIQVLEWTDDFKTHLSGLSKSKNSYSIHKEQARTFKKKQQWNNEL